MKVLCIDHDPDMRSYVSMILEASLDCDVIEFSSIQEFISFIEIEPIEEAKFILSEVEIAGSSASELVDWFYVNKIPIPFVWLSSPENENKLVVQESYAQKKGVGFIPKPFKDDEFFPVIDEIISNDKSFLIQVNDESYSPDLESDKANSSESGGEEPGTISEDASDKNKDDVADWDIQTKKQSVEEVDADWGIGGKKSASDEVEADWGIGSKSSSNGEVEADWDINAKGNAAEQEADWDINAKGNAAEQEADWDLNTKGDAAEQEADWDLNTKGDAAEQEADWNIEAKGDGTEEEADWDINAKGDVAEQEADWDIDAKGDGAEEEADWDINGKGDATEQEAGWDISNKSQSENENTEVDNQKEKSSKNESEKGSDLYKKVKIKRVKIFNKLSCDLFIKLSEKKYIKLVTANEEYEQTQIQKYIDKGVKFLYVKFEDYPAFASEFSSFVFKNLSKVKKDTPAPVRAIADLAAYENIQENVKELGIIGPTAENIEKSIESTLSTVSEMKELDLLLSSIMRGQNYISEHSLLLSYIVGKMGLASSWSSNQSLEKLTMAALLHDISIPDDFIARKHDDGEADFSEASDGIKKIINEHPQNAAELITSGKHIFSDVESIILQHHERPDGKGYPKGLSSSVISPLSCMFIIAEDFTQKVLAVGIKNLNWEEIEEDYKKFDTGHFKQPLQSFFSAFRGK